MLNPKDNERLCQTGAGTPMGQLLREYWWPVLRADKLEPDGAPQRVRLMGENYVAWRATDGRLGFFDEYCPHRRVSLALARNEDCALRCIMHGWKIDVTGKVLETPNEVEAGARLERIKVRHFPIREAGNIVWVYVGEKAAPPFPDFQFNEARTIEPLICEIDANWIQVFETLWDPAHVQILHAQDGNFKKAMADSPDRRDTIDVSLAVPKGWVRDEAWGFSYGGGRFGDGAGVPTVMPCWIFINPISTEDPGADRLAFAHTPVDDTHMLLWEIPYNLINEFGPFGQVTSDAVGQNKHNFRLDTMDPATTWGQDRAAMRTTESFSGLGVGKGVLGLLNQDVAVAESMGAITDRAREHLGPADYALIKGRQVFLAALEDYEKTGKALGLGESVLQVGGAIAPKPENVAAE